MTEIKIGDFVEIDTKNLSIAEQCRKYIIAVTNSIYNDCDKILELEGVIVEANIQNSSFKLFKKRKYFLKNKSLHTKKVTDLVKIKELKLKYNLHLLQKS